MALNQVEIDYTEYLAQKRGVSVGCARNDYESVRVIHDFNSQAFKLFMIAIHNLFSPVYGDSSERELYETYRFHAALHLYRHIGYSYNRLSAYARLAKKISDLIGDNPITIIDYGCGLGYIPMALYAILPDTAIHLVDIDGMVLDFATWRYHKYGVPYSAIRVRPENPYPELPPHNVCLALESMEHLLEPLTAYKNINAAMDVGGLLIGDFGDHTRQLFHVSTDLRSLREAIARDYVRRQPKIFEKVR